MELAVEVKVEVQLVEQTRATEEMEIILEADEEQEDLVSLL
jgi:hypothetical protein